MDWIYNKFYFEQFWIGRLKKVINKLNKEN